MHGANRLGGNGVANSTVFGGIAGDAMPALGAGARRVRASPTTAAIDAAIARCARAARRSRAGDLEAMRERLYDVMWDDVGIVRDAASLARARSARSTSSTRELDATGVAGADLAFNLTWHDWLNLKSLIAVSKVIAVAALAREDSRGAHFRADFPASGDLETSTYTVARQQGADIAITHEPVRFTRVRPGESLLTQEPQRAIA